MTTPAKSSRYDLAKPILEGERLLCCTECGALIADSYVTAHDRWHRKEAMKL